MFSSYMVDTYVSENSPFSRSLWAHSNFNNYFYNAQLNIFAIVHTLLKYQIEIYIKNVSKFI